MVLCQHNYAYINFPWYCLYR